MPNYHSKVLSWAPDIDGKTLAQAERSASLPFVQPHVALMPDAHYGYGATVGSVIPTQGAIIPSAVGVDIGCGMIAARLSLTAADLPDDLGPLHAEIAKNIPAGLGQAHEEDAASYTYNLPELTRHQPYWTDRLKTKLVRQFGTLGSGNHFVEVCLDEADQVWIVLHSGSRGVGNELANLHIDGAKDLMKRYFMQSALPDGDLDLAYLVEDTEEFDRYIADMRWAQDYAMGNRERMLASVLHSFEMAVTVGKPWTVDDRINCHHNFTEREHHMGRNMWITRKGAIRARTGDRGVIPGSMGAASYIVRGTGNTASFTSCSHGAGRRMSRSQAKKTLDRETLRSQMNGIVWNDNVDALIDEDPRAYKDIDEVMAAQEDLVTIEHRLHQILNYKGT